MKLFQKIEVLLALGLLIAFFLPWGKVFFFTGSGYDLAVNFDGDANALWAIPAACIAIAALAFYDANTRLAALITGIFPFIVLARACQELGKDTFEVLAIGAYIAMIIGVALIAFGLGILKSPDW